MDIFVKAALVASFGVCMPLVGRAVNNANDSVKVKTNECHKQVNFDGELYLETNLGHKRQAERHSVIDFPHIVVSGELSLPNGWSITAEMEYERLREDGEWGNRFRDNYTTNMLYASKQWSDAIALKAGIIDVPVGVTNSRGEALTVYNPLSEAAMMPMTWHEAGVAVHGALGRWHYEAGALAYIDAPINSNKMLGADARLSYWIVDDDDRYANVGAGAYWGSSSKGIVRFQAPDFVGTDGLLYTSLDYSLSLDGFVSDGSWIYCSDGDAHSLGAELGYNVLQGISQKAAVLPFVRYDGLWNIGTEHFSQLTLGLNIEPLPHLTLKAQHSWCMPSYADCGRRWDVGVGYTVCF